MKYKIMIPAMMLVLSVSPIFGIDIEILATNTWTAAFVEAAGGEASILAPSSMEHPPEYELKPSDVRKVRDAELLVYAGYEVLMKTVFDSFDKPEEQLLQIVTSYSPMMLENSVLAIAVKLGTSDTAGQNIAAYKTEFAKTVKRLKDAGLHGAPVIVQFHQKPLIEALGFDVLAVIGPQPLEIRQIAELGKMKPRLIIDNAHNPMAAPLEEILGIDAVELVNFPGGLMDSGESFPLSLIEILKLNSDKLIESK